MENSYWKKACVKLGSSVLFFARFSLCLRFGLFAFFLFEFTFEELIRASHRTAVIFHFLSMRSFGRSVGSVDSVESINTAFIPFIQ